MVLGFLIGWVVRGWTETPAIEPRTDTQLDEEPISDEDAVLEPDELERLLTEAHAAAAKTPLDRDALLTLARIEDVIYKCFEVAWRAWEKNNQNPALRDRKQAHEDLYKAILKLSDDAVERFFTPEVVEGLPWRDLLAVPGAWKTSELQGFEHEIENGVLHLVGPDPPAHAQGIMSIGDQEVWRDLVLEMEFTILEGSCELFFRLPLVWQVNVESRELSTDDGILEAGRPYTYLFRVIGSTLLEGEKGDSSGPLKSSISWTQIRKGAIGISVPKNTEIVITRLRARILR